MSTRGTLWYFSTMIKSARWAPDLTLHKYHEIIDDGVYFEISVSALSGTKHAMCSSLSFRIADYSIRNGSAKYHWPRLRDEDYLNGGE